MAVKTINDTAGPNGLVPTLLVFGAYPRINIDSPPEPDILVRGNAIRKAMKMLRAERDKANINRAMYVCKFYYGHAPLGYGPLLCNN
jgi:hypothetical protein